MVNVVETPLRHEKELPLEEMRHHVVNSLQIIAGIIRDAISSRLCPGTPGVS